MDLFTLLPWIILIIFSYLYFSKNKPHNKKIRYESQVSDNLEIKGGTSHNSYQKKLLLTKNEYHEYKKLRYYAENHDFLVCPKVRLLDLVEPRRGEGFMSALGKIQSKHIDFVICDQNLYVKGIVEIDDNSHNRQDRQQRDLFVDEVLTSVGYTVIRTRAVTEETLKPILPVHTTSTETGYSGQDPAQADTDLHQ